MRFHAFLPIAVAGAALAACEPVFLDALHADLSLTPTSTARVVWLGHPTAIPLVLANTSRVGLDVEPPVLGAAAALVGAQVLNAPTRIEGAQALPFEVALSPTADTDGAVVQLTVDVAPVDDEVAPVHAVLELEVRTPPPCAPRDPCESAAFDPVLGECVRTAHPDGEACSDGSACTEDDRCSSGTCVGRAITCADSVDCTLDTCDPARGCVFEPIHSRCDDDNACTTDTCVPQSGCARATVVDGTPCGPFSCTQLETCFYGVCVAAPTPDGFPCEDGDLCTTGDTCVAQQCVSGTLVEPTAQPATAVARPTVHVDEDVRWYQEEHLADAIDVPAGFDTTLRFGEALDLAQGLVGFRPTLAVLWKSEPFGLDGRPCAPWDLWAYPRDPWDAAFCATAVVVTFFDEGELARGEGGTSVVLTVAYGTVDASFSVSPDDVDVDDGPPGDTVEVVLAESTYFPRPDSGRELWLERIALSLSTRSVTARTRQPHYSGPAWLVENNVHAGVRVADQGGATALVGWDLPRWPNQPDGPDGRAGEADSGAAAMPWLEVTLDRGVLTAPSGAGELGQAQWSPLLYDECGTMPLATEDLAWRDVEAFHYAGAPWTLLRFDPYGGYGNGCGEYVEPTSAVLLPEDPTADELPWIGLGDDVLSVSITPRAESLAMVRPFPCIDTLLECPPFTVQVMSPPLGAVDPMVTTWSTTVGDVATVHARAVALAPHFGAQGAVVLERDLLGDARVKLVDALNTESPLVLTSAPLALAERPARALRSPLSAQSVYAVATQAPAPDDIAEDFEAEGLVVRFGCPFPSFPSVVSP